LLNALHGWKIEEMPSDQSLKLGFWGFRQDRNAFGKEM